MGMGASQYLCIEHAGEFEVAAVFGFTGNPLYRVYAGGGVADGV